MPFKTISGQLRVEEVCLKPEEQIQAHMQDTWELAYVQVGSGIRTIGDQVEAFRAGEVVLIPPGISHWWRFDIGDTDADGKIANIGIFFNTSLIEYVARTIPDLAYEVDTLRRRKEAVRFHGAQLKKIRQLMVQLPTIRQKSLKAIRILELLVALGAASDTESVVGRGSNQTKTAVKVEKVRIYCVCNYRRSVTLGDAAAHIGMNLSSFCKFFLKNFGQTFSRHINGLRIDECCRQLRSTDYPVADIAYSAGFSSIPYFNRVFHDRCGCSPSVYRRSIHTSPLPA